jgi:hypothetical protein
VTAARIAEVPSGASISAPSPPSEMKMNLGIS